MVKDRAHEYWVPEPLFAGETVVCVASGPSLDAETCARIRTAASAGRCRSIAVNSSWRLAPFADVLYFTDSGWYLANRETVKTWPGLVVSMSPTAKRELPDVVRRVKAIGDPSFPPRHGGVARFPAPGSPEIQQGRNSGNTAVGLAIAMGAARVVLVGYDCRIVGGKEHFHVDEAIYQGKRDLGLYDNEFRHAFRGWHEAACNSGVEILNCTPGSAIDAFPFADLDEELACTAP
ncbi:hypothetical protein [Mesorhizobium sp. CAU 1741]|uniref:hypothetical protein n=1 Tax=Mesorhizobium sp. CAU 1741 TaxID=3140366 RepID=UPI00325BBF0C